MQSNMHNFPADEFMECLRNNRSGSAKYIEEVNNLNTEWIYQIIKHCHNTITQPKELPSTKLSSLLMVRDLMETCQISCFNLIEAYILPIIYQIAIIKPQEKGDRRGSTFFQAVGRGAKISNIQDIGIKFVAMCPEILFAGSTIKPKRIYEGQQLHSLSDFSDYFERYKNYGISPVPNSLASLKNFSPEFAANGRQKYLNNLKQFHRGTNNYSEYFVTKIIDSVETDNNALLNNGQSVSSLSNDLDMRKLLKQADTVLTTPLIDQLMLKLKNIPSFMSKKHCLSLLIDFVKWGDIQALVKICSDDIMEKVGLRIAEIDGNKGLVEGEKIYPEVKGQRDGKRKFYTEYLKSIEVLTNCLQNQNIDIEEGENIEGLYNYFKKEKKFEFPQNLMAKKIETEFQHNLKNNMERNELVMRRLRQTGSVMHKGSSRSRLSKQNLGVSATLIQINKNLDDCLDEIFKVTSNQNQVNARMTKIIELRNRFQDQIEKIDENNSEIKQDEMEQILDNGQQITKIVEKLEILHKDYRNKTINFQEFKQRHASITREYQDESLQHSRGTEKNLAGSNGFTKNSQEEVVSSFNTKKGKNPDDITASFKKVSEPKYEEAVKDPQLNLKNNLAEQHKMIRKTSPTHIESSQNKLLTQVNPLHYDLMPVVNAQQVNQLVDPLVKAPKNIQDQNEDQVLNQVTSSILSNKQAKKKSLKQQSKISQMRYEDGSSKVFSESKSLYERAMARKKQKSKLKQSSHRSSKQSSKNGQNSFHSVNDGNQSSFKNSQGDKKSKQSKGQVVEYVQYYSPQSIEIQKLNQISQPKQQKSYLLDPQNIDSSPKFKNGSVVYYDQQSASAYGFRQSNNGQIKGNQENNYVGNPHNSANITKENNLIHVVDRVDESGSRISQSSGRRSNMRGKSGKGESSISQQGSQRNSNSNSISNSAQSRKGQPIKSGFAAALGASNPSNFRDHFSHSQPSSEFKTCKASLSQNENVESQQQNFVLNSKEYAEQQKQLRTYPGQNNNREFFTAKSSGFSNSPSINMQLPQNNHYELNNPDSYIEQPPCNPTENSYYAPKDIEDEVRKSTSPLFKNCFQIQKELIPSAHNFKYDLPELLAEQNGSRTRKVGASNLTNKQSLVKPHEQYMIAKLRRDVDKQKDSDARQLGSRVVSLKVENSRLRNQLISKQNNRPRWSDSEKYSSVEEFSHSKSRESNSPQIRRHPDTSGGSAVSSIIAQGNLINQNLADRIFSQLNDDRLKKACLRNKTIIYKSDLWEIGSMFSSTQQVTNLILYLTPNSIITNFKYSISKEPNLDIETSSKGFTEIPEGKQVKIQVICKLKNIPYNLPIMNLKYRIGNQDKNISFYLPLTFNKFARFSPVDPTKISNQLRNAQKVLRTSQFTINPKIAKTSNILEYFPNMVNVGQQIKQKVTRYATMGSFRNETFFILLTTKGKDKVLLQGKSSNPQYNQYVQYAMLTIKKLMCI